MRRKKQKEKVINVKGPKGKLQWVTTVILFAVILYCSLILIARVTDGRIGIMPVIGDSMDEVPWGSHVIVIPIEPNSGDLVSARMFGVDHPEVVEDTWSSLVIKRLEGNALVSSVGIKFHNFEVRGKVVCIVPAQKVFFWTNRMACNKVERKPLSPEEQARKRNEIAREKKQKVTEEKDRLMKKGLILGIPLPAKVSDLDPETKIPCTKEWKVEWDVTTVSCFKIEIVDQAGGETEYQGMSRADVYIKKTQWVRVCSIGPDTSLIVFNAPVMIRGIRIVPRVPIIYINELMFFK